MSYSEGKHYSHNIMLMLFLHIDNRSKL